MSAMQRCPGPISRRQALQVGAIGATGLGLSDLFRLRAHAALPGASSDTAVILVWCPGGVSQIDTYDLKPGAPDAYRLPFQPIKTNVPGIEISELFPMQARIADKFSLIRSMHHRFGDHGGGHKLVMTGFSPKTPTGFVNDRPAVASVVAKFRADSGTIMPASIVLADKGRTQVDTFSLGSAWLGPAYNPLEVGGDPSDSKFKVDSISLNESLHSRLDDRRRLLQTIDRMRRDIDNTGSIAAMDSFSAKAFDLFTSAGTRDAFDVSREDEATRDRYGCHSYGQRCLMARRLVEAGASFVTVVLESPPLLAGLGSKPKGVGGNWDCHAVNYDVHADTKYRLPIYDQALSALIEDVHARGLHKKVLVVATGEFGHTPKLEHAKNRPGRGHWTGVFSMLVSGGGLAAGQVVGSSDARAEFPKDRPLGPEDLWATVYRHLGIDTSKILIDNTGRPVPLLASGQPIRELVG